MPKVHSPSRFAVILAFGLVYLLWGSTYLAIDIAVQKIPPALMCAVRFSIAGVVNAGGMRPNRSPHCVFGPANRSGGGGRDIAPDGRKFNTRMGGAIRPIGFGGADHRYHAAVVSGAGFVAAGPSSHFVAGKSWDSPWASQDYSFCSGRSCIPRRLWDTASCSPVWHSSVALFPGR